MIDMQAITTVRHHTMNSQNLPRTTALLDWSLSKTVSTIVDAIINNYFYFRIDDYPETVKSIAT